jgi:hypothetical protein
LSQGDVLKYAYMTAEFQGKLELREDGSWKHVLDLKISRNLSVVLPAFST